MSASMSAYKLVTPVGGQKTRITSILEGRGGRVIGAGVDHQGVSGTLYFHKRRPYQGQLRYSQGEAEQVADKLRAIGVECEVVVDPIPQRPV